VPPGLALLPLHLGSAILDLERRRVVALQYDARRQPGPRNLVCLSDFLVAIVAGTHVDVFSRLTGRRLWSLERRGLQEAFFCGGPPSFSSLRAACRWSIGHLMKRS
jgi:hypothetical protein